MGVSAFWAKIVPSWGRTTLSLWILAEGSI